MELLRREGHEVLLEKQFAKTNSDYSKHGNNLDYHNDSVPERLAVSKLKEQLCTLVQKQDADAESEVSCTVVAYMMPDGASIEVSSKLTRSVPELMFDSVYEGGKSVLAAC